MDDPNPSRDLSVAVLITKALDSLWDVTRRRYTGASGSITYINKAAVQMAIYGTTMQAMNLLKRLISELIKLKADGTVDGMRHHPHVYRIPREWSMDAAQNRAQTRLGSASGASTGSADLLHQRSRLPAHHAQGIPTRMDMSCSRSTVRHHLSPIVGSERNLHPFTTFPSS